jgi:hypothetical protein
MKLLNRVLFRMALCAILPATLATAASISLVPATPTASVGDDVVLNLVADDIELGGYSLLVGFSPTATSFISRVYGHALNDPFLQATGAAGLDTVEVSELSFEDASVLGPLQVSPFLLAILTFRADAAGTALFSLTRANLSQGDLTDYVGNPLSNVVLSGASVAIGQSTPPPTGIPEPGTAALALAGVLGIAFMRHRA